MDTLDRLLLVLSPSRPPGTWSLHDRRWHTVGLSELHAKCLLGKCANEVWHSEAFSKSKPQSTKLIEFLQKKKKRQVCTLDRHQLQVTVLSQALVQLQVKRQEEIVD